jgi:transcription initiation factor TFIIIB Brf1 subunit/transcription initiation factor TFIIB
MSNPCAHPDNYVVEDLHDGTFVCSLCARVIDQVYSCANSDITTYVQSVDNLVTTICDNCNYDDCIRNSAQSVYETVNSKLGKRRYSDIEIAAYAVYKALKSLHIPISGKELFSVTNVSMRKIWQMENICEKNSYADSNSELIHYIERYGAYCQLCFVDIRNIIKKIDEVTAICLNHAVQNIAASMIYMYSKKYSVQSIAKLCNVSATCIYRIVKLLNEQLK